jgi:hypothetical protein
VLQCSLQSSNASSTSDNSHCLQSGGALTPQRYTCSRVHAHATDHTQSDSQSAEGFWQADSLLTLVVLIAYPVIRHATGFRNTNVTINISGGPAHHVLSSNGQIQAANVNILRRMPDPNFVLVAATRRVATAVWRAWVVLSSSTSPYCIHRASCQVEPVSRCTTSLECALVHCWQTPYWLMPVPHCNRKERTMEPSYSPWRTSLSIS